MKSNLIHSIPALADISEAFIDPLMKEMAQKKIRSSLEVLTDFMGGGLPCQTVSEFGIPLGRGGRELFLTFISQTAREGKLTLWVNGHNSIRVFPPAWSARGTPLSTTLFAESQNPVTELKKAFISPLFNLIVLDTGKFQVGKNELAFLKKQAQLNRQTIIVIRDHFLSNMLGNVWVRLRVNIWKDHRRNSFKVKIVRGLPPSEISIPEKLIPKNLSEPSNNLDSQGSLKRSGRVKKNTPPPVGKIPEYRIKREGATELDFIAIRTKEVTPEKLQCLTSHIMRWSEDIWLFDLRGFISYWEREAASRGVGPLSLIRRTLDTVFGEHSLDSRLHSLSPPYSAAAATHPWQALLLLQCMEKRGARGLLSLSSKPGRELYRAAPWEIWWKCTTQISVHLTGTGSRNFKPQKFKQFCLKLKLSAGRLNFSKPDDMRILNRGGVERRFGTLLAYLWEWSFASAPPYQEIDSPWPWVDEKFREKPSIRRTLDYSPPLWEHLLPFLTEDLDRLLDISKIGSYERVTMLVWEISIEEGVVKIPIRFRNPHNMPGERGEHLTTLSVARQSFYEIIREKFKGRPDFMYGAGTGVPLILSWKIVLEESIFLTEPCPTLFEESDERKRVSQLLQFQNEVSLPIRRYALNRNWAPEESYREVGLDLWEERSSFTPSLKAAATLRPLFTYKRSASSKPLPPVEIRYLEPCLSD